MKLRVKVADLKDSEFINELSNQLGYETTNDNNRNWLRKILNNKDNYVFVAVDDEKIIG